MSRLAWHMPLRWLSRVRLRFKIKPFMPNWLFLSFTIQTSLIPKMMVCDVASSVCFLEVQFRKYALLLDTIWLYKLRNVCSKCLVFRFSKNKHEPLHKQRNYSNPPLYIFGCLFLQPSGPTFPQTLLATFVLRFSCEQASRMFYDLTWYCMPVS